MKFRALAFVLLLAGVSASVSCNCLCSKGSPVEPPPGVPAAIEPGKPWRFVVSGDSRNCGDVVMPAIAQSADHNKAQFYWHLGDLRAIYDFDEDMKKVYKLKGKHLSIIDYEENAWPDFEQNQIVPFGKIPFLLGIGNHEMIPPKTREQFETQFASWLDQKLLKDQRSKDQKVKIPYSNQPATYFHWIMDGVDFIYLDNAVTKTSNDQFSPQQMKWFEAVIARDAKDPAIHTVIAGMHAALPESISRGHSMNEWPLGEKTGKQVYLDLLALQNTPDKKTGKKIKVYVLASHSHYYMEDIFNTQYWRTNGGVLEGWIVGTAGAHRYPLPQPNAAKVAKTNVYGYMIGTANPPNEPLGTVDFEFKELSERDIPRDVQERYSPAFVHWCFVDNSDVKSPSPTPEP
jgi:hypothetical protein